MRCLRVRDRTWLSLAKIDRANNLWGLEIVYCVFFFYFWIRTIFDYNNIMSVGISAYLYVHIVYIDMA
jgi:hypothetical protein